MGPLITLEAMRLANESLSGVSFFTGIRACGAPTWQRSHDMEFVKLTRTHLILAPRVTRLQREPWGYVQVLSERKTSFSLLSGVSAPRNGVEQSLHPTELERLQELLSVCTLAGITAP